jgi:hypothetical protein
MLTLKECKDINRLVRELFKAGFKSSNKIYLPGSQVIDDPLPIHGDKAKAAIANISDPKHLKRLSDRTQAKNHRLRDLRPDMGSAVKLLEARFDRTIAGNCGEMAILAAGYACEFDPVARVYKCSLGEFKPGYEHDHCFCLAQPSFADLRKADKSVTGVMLATFPGKVKDLVGLDRKLNFWIIDPWLNVACEAPDYVQAVKAKLAKWDLANKRIQFYGQFYRPTDKGYVNAFVHSSILVTTFTAAMH